MQPWGKVMGAGIALNYVNGDPNVNDSEKRVCILPVDHISYAQQLEMNPELIGGLKGILEGDQIVSFHNKMQYIQNLLNAHAPTVQILEAIYSNDIVKKWASTIVYIMLEATEPKIIQQNPSTSKYLSIFLDTINNTIAVNDNIAKGVAGLDPNQINILTLDSTINTMLGCYSSTYYLVPMTEINNVNNASYKEFVNNNHIQNLCSVYDRCRQMLIRACSNSLDTTQYPILKLIQLIVDSQIPQYSIALPITPLNQTDAGGNRVYPYNFNLYQLQNAVDTNSLFTDHLYIIKVDNDLYTTYPFTAQLKDSIENGTASISQISLNKVGDNAYNFSYQYSTNIIIGETPQTLVYSSAKEYTFDSIYFINSMPTFCMFPNLPTDVERYWEGYSYLQDIQQVMLYPDNLDGALNVVNIVSFKNLDFETINQIDPNCHTLLATTDSVKHFIEPDVVYTDNTTRTTTHFNDGGYILNFEDVEPLLKVGTTVNSIALSSNTPVNFAYDLEAYVDFGSSSSCIQLKIKGAAEPLPNSNINGWLVRSILAKYTGHSYEKEINITPENINFNKFMSISKTRSNVLNNFEAYVQSWMPMITIDRTHAVENARLIDSIKPEASRKTNLSVDGQPAVFYNSPNIIIHNIVYSILVNAVANKCKQVTIIPSLPNKSYEDKMKTYYNSAIAIYSQKILIKPFNVYNALNYSGASKVQYLYESLVSTNTLPVANQLYINVDIGDGTTDFSAVYFDNNPMGTNKYMCGYSSIEYAGKNILKQVFYNIMFNSNLADVDGTKKFHMLMGDSVGNFQPFFDFKAHGDTHECEWAKANIQAVNKDNYETYFDLFFNKYGLNLSPNMDVKISSNLAMRYVLLMPIVLDFIKVARKNLDIIGVANIPNPLNVTINFCGGASKGIDALQTVSTMYNKIGLYFKNNLPKYNLQLLNLGCSSIDSKELIINGLSSHNLQIAPQTDGTVQIQINGIQPIGDNISPSDLGKAHTRNLDSNFLPLQDNPIMGASNLTIINNPSTHFRSDDNLDTAIVQDFVEYFRKEIYEKLINNGDSNIDPIEELFHLFIPSKDAFMTSNDPDCASMKQYIVQQLNTIAIGTDNTIFGKVVRSDIYPEMMKHSMYMFIMSELLTKYHNEFDSNRTYSMSAVAGVNIKNICNLNFGINKNIDGNIECIDNTQYGIDKTLS